MEVEVATHLLTEDELVERIKGFNAILLGAPRLTRRVLLAADSLELISRGGIGVDNIDIPTATEKGIVVTNVLDTLSKTVAEHIFMFILGITRDVVVADRSVRTGEVEGLRKGGAPRDIREDHRDSRDGRYRGRRSQTSRGTGSR